MSKLKRVAAIHDISCVGKCSLTVALPIISACGVECAVIPTAVLSTHTGGFTNFTYRDLTNDLLPIAEHWKSLDLKLDALYSGFLGSYEQIDIVAQIFKQYKAQGSLIMVDPVMADHGKLYSIYTNDMVKGMVNLCKYADLIVPNMTEASFMLGIDYMNGIHSKEYILDICQKLQALGPNKVVLTGVMFDENEIGAVSLEGNDFNYYSLNKIDGNYHGTGDIFGSVLLSAIMNGKSLKDATKIAVDFTHSCIARTYNEKTDLKYGVNFEKGLNQLTQLFHEES